MHYQQSYFGVLSLLCIITYHSKTADQARVRGLTLPKIVYEISKSLDFEKDFSQDYKISLEISRCHLRFQDLGKILRFQ